MHIQRFGHLMYWSVMVVDSSICGVQKQAYLCRVCIASEFKGYDTA
jgi:hypothetical protein